MLAQVFRRAGAIAIGTGVGQGLVLLATPFLARIYTPADFGALALLMTVSNVSIAASCMRYDMALPSAEDDEVRGLLITSMIVAATLGVLSAGLAWLASGNRAAAEHSAGLLDRPLLIGACVVLVGLHQATSAWLLRRGAYGGVAAMRLSQGGGFSVLAFLQPLGLLWAHVASFAGGLLAVWRVVRTRTEPGAPWTEAARRNRKFPLYSLPGALLDVVGYSLCIWVVATFYGSSAAGEYSQIQRIIGAPAMLMSMSLGQILLRHTAELVHDTAQMRRLLQKLVRLMAWAALLAVPLLILAGKQAISAILGPKWHVEREMVVLLGITVLVRACVSPLSSALITLRRFGLALSWQAAYFCSAALLMPLVAGRVGLAGYVRFYVVHEAVFYGIYLYLIFFAVQGTPCAESSAS